MTFGERLVECMEAAGISQRKLAGMVGATPTQLNYWAKDKRQPDIPYIRKLAKALGVSTDRLIGNDDFDGNESVSDEAMKVARAFDKMSDYGKSMIEAILQNEKKYEVKARLPVIITAHDSNVYAQYHAKQELKELQQEESDSGVIDIE